MRRLASPLPTQICEPSKYQVRIYHVRPLFYWARLSTLRIADRWIPHFWRACTFLFVKDPPPPFTAPTTIYARVCVLVDLEIASIRLLRALQYIRRYVRLGSLFWPISSLESGELLILIP